MVDRSAPAPGREPVPVEGLRQRRESARVRRAAQRRVIMLCAMLVIAIAVGEWAAFAGAGGQAVRHTRAKPVVAGRHGHGGSRAVRLVVEASGDLLIHSAVFERALVLGGGRHYNFAPLFAQIKPYIRGADLALCHVETPMTPAPATGYPVFNTPPALATAIRQTGWRACSAAAPTRSTRGKEESMARSARWIAPGWRTPAPSRRRPHRKSR